MEDFAISCFLAVVETGSFTKAGQKVNRTQSAVTQQIGKLEKALGRKLFKRDKKVTVTKDGELFLHYARKLYGLYREVLDCFTHPELEGEIMFGLPEDFAIKFLSEILIDFTRIHPRILLNVVCDLTMNLFHRFKKGEFDMVLVKMIHPESFPHGVEVWSEPLEWVGEQKILETLDTKKPLPLILSPEPCVYRAQALKALNEAGVRWRMAFSSPSYVGTLAAVRAGIGLTVLPQTLIPSSLALIQDAFLPALPDIHVSLLTRSKTTSSLKTLEAFLLEKLGRITPSIIAETV